MCLQAQVLCTTSRAKNVTLSLSLVALIVEVINSVCYRLAGVQAFNYVKWCLFRAVVPVAVLVINVVVLVQVRRAASNAAANLGVQPHHQSTSWSNSAVPTAMLIATSIIYVLLYSTLSILLLFCRLMLSSGDSISDTSVVTHKLFIVARALVKFVFAYNFYVYLITGRKFRSELRKLFCRRVSSSSSAAAAAAAANA